MQYMMHINCILCTGYTVQCTYSALYMHNAMLGEHAVYDVHQVHCLPITAHCSYKLQFAVYFLWIMWARCITACMCSVQHVHSAMNGAHSVHTVHQVHI